MKLSVLPLTLALLIGCSSNSNRDFPSQKPWFTTENRENWAAAKRQGKIITLLPSNGRFQIPDGWVDWYKDFGDNIHVTREQLQKIALPKGQWDPEFASVCNRVFPYDRCAVHVGGEGWGKDSVAYTDLQVRVYDLSDTIQKTKRTLKAKGLKELQRITGAKMKQLEGKKHFRECVQDDWHVVQLTFWRLYSYYSDATVDCRLKRVGDRTLVFVFMYTDSKTVEGEIKSILASFQANTN